MATTNNSRTKRTSGEDSERRHEKFCEYFTSLIESSGKTQFQIAKELDYANQNFITLIKKGKSPLPIAKVGEFAIVLGADPAHFLRIYLDTYYPELLKTITNALKKNLVSQEEMNIIKIFREASDDHVVGPQTEAEKQELRDLAAKFQKHHSVQTSETPKKRSKTAE